jgi:hypothetical protein
MSEMLRRTIHPKTRVLDEAKGLVEYVASDETLDSYREIIRAEGWRFDERFETNPTFVDSHSYWGIADCLGRVVEWRVSGKQLIEVVQWAIDVEENALAQLGFRMTAKGYLKAVSVGFLPVKVLSRGRDQEDDFSRAMDDLALEGEARDKARTIYWEQQQIELSACVLGANPSALARAFGDGAVSGDLLGRCGLPGDEGQEMLGLSADAWEATTDPAVQKLVTIQLRQYAGRNISASRPARRSAAAHPGHGATGAGASQSPRATRDWLKRVARQIG